MAPYPGLRPYRTDEAELFYGRDNDVVGLTERIVTQRRVILVGPSGSGKSSLINAGLVPQIESGFYGDAPWCVVRLRPGVDPLGSLAAALDRDLPWPVDAAPRAPAAVALRADTGALAEELAARAGGRPVLLIADQFEEVFRYRPRLRSPDGWTDEVEHFVELLVRASAPPAGPARLLVGMRGEFVARCAEFETLSGLVNEALHVLPPLTTMGVRAAVTQPAALRGAVVEEDVVIAFQAAVQETDLPLPLLEHALRQVWDVASASDAGPPRVARPHLDAIGGIHRALGRHADQTLAASVKAGVERDAIERLFRRLCFVDGQGVRQRNPATVGELAPLLLGAAADEGTGPAGVQRALGLFVEAGFLTASPPQAAWTAGTVVDLAHESLLTRWETLSSWLAEEAADVNRFRRLVDYASAFYAPSGVMLPPELLNDGEALRARTGPLGVWATRVPGLGTPENVALIEAMLRESRAWRTKEEEEEREEAARRARADAEAEAARAEVKAQTAVAAQARAENGRQRALIGVAILTLVLLGGAWWMEKARQSELMLEKASAIRLLSEELDRYAVESEALQAQVIEATKAQEAARAELAQAEQVLAQQRAQGTLTEAERTEAQAKVQQLKAEYLRKKRDAESLTMEKAALGAQLEALSQETTRFKRAAAKSGEAVKALEEQVKRYADENGKLQSEKESALKRATEAESKLTATQGDLTRANTALDAARASLATCEARPVPPVENPKIPDPPPG